MNPFEHIKTLEHHAYFLQSAADTFSELTDYFNKELNILHRQNPDFFYEKYGVLGVDESRKIKDNHLSKSFVEGGKRIFVIECSGMTHEAQNSLLKIFEEPHEDSHFFLLMPTAEVLLPTLRSRLYIIKSEEVSHGDGVMATAEKFLKLSKKDRVAFAEDLAKRISDEEATKSDAQEFLAALEHVLYQKGVEKNTRGLKAVLKARDYLNDRSPSIKQLLGYVALSV